VNDYFVPVQTADDGSFRQLSFNAQTLLIAHTGDRLMMGVNAANDVSNMFCKVAGDLVFLN